MKTNFALLIILLTLVQSNNSANILCMFTTPSKSQMFTFMAVANSLIDRDHNVTIVTTVPIPRPSLNKKPFRHIFLESPEEATRYLKNSMLELTDLFASKFKIIRNIFLTFDFIAAIQKRALETQKFQDFLKEDNHFDLMVLGYFHNEFMVGVAARYRSSIALVSLAAPYGTINRVIGNPAETSYVQIPFFGKSQPMSFLERAKNFLWSGLEPFVQALADFRMTMIYRTLFPDDSYPPYCEVIKNISLVLYNRHFSEMPIRPLVPALVEIGGIQDEDQSEFLQPDIKEFLDASVNGSIFFRVGSNARNTELKQEHINIILKTLSNLNQTVVFEWERPEDPPTNYPNIMFRPSIIPNTILPHRNIKLYITDGRPLAIQEATYHGVPMFGLPMFGEEPFTVEEMQNSEFGVSLDVHSMTEESFNETLFKVLLNPYYAEKVRKFSQLFRDRPNTAKETAAFWLEYVIRHRGAMHMQSPLVHMSFVKRWNIDLIVVLSIAAWLFVKVTFIMGVIVRTIVYQRTCRQKLKYKFKYQ